MSDQSGRSNTGVDDIDGDDCTTATTTAAAEAANGSAAAASSPAAADPSPGRSPTGLDDIDGDDEPTAAPRSSSPTAAGAAATAAASSSAAAASSRPAASAPSSASAAASSSAPLSAAAEVERILNVLSADKELAAAAAAAAGPSSDPGVAAPARAAATAQPNHFAVLGLPPPQVNAAGEGVWLVNDEELKRAFKRLVLQIHPDKNPAAGAKHAFEAVKTAHNVLSSSSSRYDYVRAYVAFTETLAMRDASFCPRAAGVGSGTLEDTLAQGKALQSLKAKQVSSFAAKLQAQAEAKLAAARAGEAARARKDELRRHEDLKRRIVHSDSDDSDSDDGRHLSVAEKIRLAKGKQKKKIRAL